MTRDKFTRATHKHNLFLKIKTKFLKNILYLCLNNIMYVGSQGHVRFYLENNIFLLYEIYELYEL